VLAEYLRQSLWLYPIINTGHIIGIVLFVGSIVPQDLKLLGCWPSITLKTFLKITRPLSYCGAAITFIFGLLLFITRLEDYLASTIFLTKLFCICLALLNAGILLNASYWKEAIANNTWGKNVQLHALISLLLWLSIIFLGRFVAYR
jgi:hypothetical protein